MNMNRSDLIELFLQLGMPSAKNWSPEKLKDRANKLWIVQKEVSENLTKDAQTTLFVAQAAISAKESGWGEEITISTPSKQKKRKCVIAYPRIRLSNRYARRLFIWMKKYGFYNPSQQWKDLKEEEKSKIVEQGVKNIILLFLHDGQL